MEFFVMFCSTYLFVHLPVYYWTGKKEGGDGVSSRLSSHPKWDSVRLGILDVRNQD